MSSHIQALLLDADGVTVLPPSTFSAHYAKQIGKQPEDFIPFFTGPFRQALAGKADLESLIREYHDLWQWDRPFKELIRDWCEYENHPNQPLIELVARLRSSDLPVYLATNQEKHRTSYLKNVMLKGVFDGIIASCEVGYTKSEPQYWAAAIARIQQSHPSVTAATTAYFDDKPKDTQAAADAGLDAHVYEGVDQVRSLVIA